MLNKSGKRDDVENFEVPPRIYTDLEIQDFHHKIQRFWDEPREVSLPGGMSGTARKFRHQDLAVAYGAARKVEQGEHSHYLYNSERSMQFNNLWKQYEDWMQKQDWIEQNLNNAEVQF